MQDVQSDRSYRYNGAYNRLHWQINNPGLVNNNPGPQGCIFSGKMYFQRENVLLISGVYNIHSYQAVGFSRSQGSGLAMGCSQAETPPYRQWWKTSDRADRDGGPDASTQPKGRPGPTLSRHAERECPNSAGSSLATTNQCETWTLDAGSAGPAERQCAVAIPSVQNTSMEPAAIHPCSTSPEKYAKGLPRSSIQSTILSLKLVNPANQCWTNSSIMAWLWTTVAARDVAWTDFGLGADKVSHLLAQNPAGGLNLFDLGFNPQDWRGDVQQDSSEYVSLLFSQFGPPRYDHRWEQRILVRETSETLLASEKAAPVILGLGAKTTTLQDVVDQ